jgi:hypothetical protein
MRSSVAFRMVGSLFLSTFAACGASETEPNNVTGHPDAGTNPNPGGPDAGNPNPGNFTVGAHPDLPQIQKGNGSVIASPKIVPIFFNGYDHRAEIVDLVNTIGAQPYWAANTSEYGVGAFTAGSPIDIPSTEPAPTTIDNTAIQTWLKGKLSGGTFGTPSASTIYTIFYPSSTTVTQGGSAGAKSCQQFGGYHDNFVSGSTNIVYAVIPECAELNNQVGVDAITAGASHEWIEAATDPLPHGSYAYLNLDADHAYWALAIGATENGDMCALGIGQNYFKPAGYSHVIQRGYSNAAAAAGNQDPCVPAVAATPYFNAGAVYPDSLTVFAGLSILTTKGVQIASGQSKTIDVQVWSTAEVGPIQVRAIDYAAATNPANPSAPANSDATDLFTFDSTAASWKASTVAHNGDTLHLTITNQKSANEFSPGTFIIVTHVGTPDSTGAYAQTNWWPGIVEN